MALFELSISKDYVPNWTVWSALREFLQNAQDEVEANPQHPMKVDYSARKKKLIITTEGVALDRSVLLLGESGKRGTKARGKFGEGLDLALLVLVRKGYLVRIENGAESWIPDIRYSDRWGRDVLVIQATKLKRARTHFRVEITGVTTEDWETVRYRCLFLKGSLKDDEQVLTVGADRVFLERPGDVYVRGLWVGKFADFIRGYDLSFADLDRDRRLIEEWKLRGKIADIWLQALSDEVLRAEARQHVKLMLDSNAKDVENLDTQLLYDYSDTHTKAKEALAEEFEEEYGTDAVPVTSTTEAAEVEQAGLRPVPVTPSWKKTLEQVRGETTKDRVAKAKESVTKVYLPEELRDLGLLERWQHVRDVAAALEIQAPVSAAEFQGDHLDGLYRDGELFIAIHLFQAAQPGRVLIALVHEAAHEVSAGHGKDHEQEVERLMELLLNLWYPKTWPDLPTSPEPPEPPEEPHAFDIEPVPF